MKKYTYLAALLAGLSVLSCSKDVKELPAPQEEADLVTIRAVLPDDDTRAGAHNGFSWYWSSGDKITVISGEDSQVYTIKEGFSSKIAEFVGKAVEGETFTILFPADKATTADWSKQTQNGNGSVDHLQYAASLEGVDDYMSFAFSPEWAGEHGGTLKQTGVMKMVIAVPETETKVTRVTLGAETPLFYKGNDDALVNKLELEMTDTEVDADHTVTAWFTTSWNELVVPSGTVLTVSVKTENNTFEKEVVFSKESTLMSGKVNTFVPGSAGWAVPTNRYASGKGTETSPWVIVNAAQMTYIQDDLKEGEIRYFKLGADIDMKDVSGWTPLNAAAPYLKPIDFDGDGHTISNFSCSAASYPSFFGVLYGKCHNVKFVNAVINASTKGCGVLGGYGGTTGLPCVVDKVHVQGTVTSSAGNNVGGFFGTARECTITNSSADVTITSSGQMTGGLFGGDAGLGVQVSNCWTAGSLVSGASICGGICGDLTAAGSSIVNCYSTMSVTTQYLFGGIIGRAVAGQKANAANCESQMPGNRIEKCIAWNTLLKSNNADTSEHYSSGTVIGATATHNTLIGCVRKADIDFQDCPGNAALGTYLPFDQEDANAETPMVKGAGTYAYSYHGKAAAAGETVSQVAQRIGWSAEIWDFSGELPKLK